MVDLVFEATRSTNIAEINATITEAADSDALRGILAINDLALVSSDFNHHPASAIFDVTQTQVTGGSLVRILSWYDNEWGFSHRMGDVAARIGSLG